MSDIGRKRVLEKQFRHQRAHRRVRNRLAGTAERPRLAVFKSLRYLYAQVINDQTGETVVQANSREEVLAKSLSGGKTSKAAAKAVGKAVAERAMAAGVEAVVFDRSGYIYHGRLQALADGAREQGLRF